MLEIKINESGNVTRTIVVGVDGVGNDAVNRMTGEDTAGMGFIGIDTDKQVLQFCKVPVAMQTGEKLTKGLGAGARPEMGEKAAEENSEEISQALKGVDMVFVACGMGDETGAGAAPVTAEIARDMGIFTVGVVTKPFCLEVKTRMSNTLLGIEQLKNSAGTPVVIPSNKLLEIVDGRTTMPGTLKKTDEVLQQAVQGITDLINVPGLINLDFADVQTITVDKGTAYIGVDKARGGDKAIGAVKQVISSPLLEATIEGVNHITINISGDISLIETNEAASCIQELAGGKANIIFGATFDENTQDGATITVIVIGLDGHGINAFVTEAITGFTSSKTRIPAAEAPVGQQAHATVPEVTATASASYTNRPASQGRSTHSYNSVGGSQGYTASKHSSNQGYSADGSQNVGQNPAPVPSQPFRPAANKEMQINVSDFLENEG